MMRIALVQTRPVFGDVAGNIDRALDMMSDHEAELFVLPELFNTGYVFADEQELRQLAEPIDGYTTLRMLKCARSKQCYIVFGLAEVDGSLYNSCALVGPDGLVGRYRKVHLFARENTMFTPGNLGFPVFDMPFGKLGLMICFDWIYPEAARSLALSGAQLIAHPSNLVLPHCPDSMIIRCLENRIFAATTNRVGRENRHGVDLRFIGKSEVVSPEGQILVRMSEDETGVRVVEVDLTMALDKRITEWNDIFAGRRKDQYCL
jgi:predicted amidohydrolase